MVVHACNSSAQEAEARGLLPVQDQPGLHGRPCVKKQNKKTKQLSCSKAEESNKQPSQELVWLRSGGQHESRVSVLEGEGAAERPAAGCRPLSRVTSAVSSLLSQQRLSLPV